MGAPKPAHMHSVWVGEALKLKVHSKPWTIVHGSKGKFQPFSKAGKKSHNSETGETTTTKIGFHAFHDNFYLHKFFELILFLTPMDYSQWVEREIWSFLKVPISPKPERLRPPNLMCMHLTSIPTCMVFWANSDQLKFLMTMDYSPWVEREIWPILKVPISPKPKRLCPPN